MKNVSISLLAIVALFAFTATGCKNENNANTSSTSSGYTDTAATSAAPATDTTSSSTETGATTGSATATTGSSTMAGTPLSDPDHKYADKFAEGDASEVAVGKIAESKASNADVKNFAQKLVTDHTNAANELEQIGKAKGITLPTELDKEHRDFEAKLNGLTGAAFDKQFVSDMVKDHDNDLKDFEKAQKEVKDPDLKAWVDKTLPVIKEHDKIAHDLEKKVGGARK